MSQKADGSVLIEAKLSLDQYGKDLAAMEKQTEGFAKGLSKGIESSAASSKNAAAGMGQLQNSLAGLTTAYARGNQAAITNINTFARQTSVIAEQALAYNSVQKAAQEAALAEKAAAEAQVTSLSALLDSLGEQVLARRREIEAMGDTAGGEAALAARTAARKELTALEQEAERAAMLLAKADDALAVSSAKVGDALKKPLGVLPALKTGFASLFKLVGGFPGLFITGAAAAISYFTGTLKKSEKDTYSFSASLEGIYGSSEEARQGINKLRQEIAAMSREQAQFNLDETEKKFKKLSAEGRNLLKLDIVGWAGQRSGFAVLDNSLNKAIQAMLAGGMAAKKYETAVYAAAKQKIIKAEEVKKFLEWGKNIFSASEGLKTLRDRVAGSGTAISNTLREIDEAAKPQNIKDAYVIFNRYIDSQDKGKKTATEAAKESARLAVSRLNEAAASEDAAGAAANLAAVQELAKGNTEAAQRFDQLAAEHFANAARLFRDAAALEAVIPEIKVGGTGGLSKTKKELMSLTDFTKKFRTELDAIRDIGGGEFAKGLQDGLKSLRSELDKVKGVTKEVREGFEREFTFAFADKSIRATKLEMMELNGQFADLAKLEIDEKVANYTAALEKASPAAREAAASAEQYKAALEKKVATDNLQDQVTFFKELADLSGDYGLSLEYQNKLIDIQAQRYKALFAKEPELQKFVDQWAELAKKAQNAQTAIERAVNVSWKRLEQGTGTGADMMTAALGSVMDGYKNAAHSTAQIWGDFFSSFSQGAADSIGQAIVYGDDLGESLNNVAQQITSSLISAFMELAIQMAIVKPLMESLGLAAADTGAGDAEAVKAKTEAELASIAEISAAKIIAMEMEASAGIASAAATLAAMTPIAAALTALWTEPAYLASVASYGAAATSGLTALQTGLQQFRASLTTAGFDEGGYTGNGSTSEVAGVVHGQEYVLSAATTRSIGVSNLNAINASGSLASVFTGKSSALSNMQEQQGGNMYVNVINNSSDSTVSQQQSTDASGNMRLDIIVDDIMAGKVVNGSTARMLQSAYGLRRTGFRV